MDPHISVSVFSCVREYLYIIEFCVVELVIVLCLASSSSIFLLGGGSGLLRGNQGKSNGATMHAHLLYLLTSHKPCISANEVQKQEKQQASLLSIFAWISHLPNHIPDVCYIPNVHFVQFAHTLTCHW